MKCRIFDGSRGEHPPQSYACRFHWFFIIVSSTKYNLSFKNAIEKKYMFEIKNIVVLRFIKNMEYIASLQDNYKVEYDVRFSKINLLCGVRAFTATWILTT